MSYQCSVEPVWPWTIHCQWCLGRQLGEQAWDHRRFPPSGMRCPGLYERLQVDHQFCGSHVQLRLFQFFRRVGGKQQHDTLHKRFKEGTLHQRTTLQPHEGAFDHRPIGTNLRNCMCWWEPSSACRCACCCCACPRKWLTSAARTRLARCSTPSADHLGGDVAAGRLDDSDHRCASQAPAL